MYLTHSRDWEKTGGLGNRQVESLKVWLKTSGLQDGRGEETFLSELFRQNGLEDTLSWEVLWINVVFNFPTAAWYVGKLGLGEWTTRELEDLLSQYIPRLAPRTARNAIMELVGLLERTPIGKELNQGIVLLSRPRCIKRTGYPFPSPETIFYATCRLFVKEQRENLRFDEEILWPWVVLGCDRKYVVQKFILSEGKHFTLTDEGLAIKTLIEDWQTCGFMLTT